MTIKIDDRQKHWRLEYGSDEDHIIPIADLREHECTGKCWCKPTCEPDFPIYVHHAMDKREEYENGRRFS